MHRSIGSEGESFKVHSTSSKRGLCVQSAKWPQLQDHGRLFGQNTATLDQSHAFAESEWDRGFLLTFIINVVYEFCLMEQRSSGNEDWIGYPNLIKPPFVEHRETGAPRDPRSPPKSREGNEILDGV